MCYKAETYINQARKYQQYGQYDFAIDLLWKAKNFDYKNMFEAEIAKLLSFNYRKLGDFNQALLHINNAIKINVSKDTEESKKDYGICLMNKGIIYEESGRNDEGLKSYLRALDIFINLDNDNNGMVINALITIGMLYLKQKKYSKVKEYLEKAIPYFDVDKENDRRYISIINTLEDIKKYNV